MKKLVVAALVAFLFPTGLMAAEAGTADEAVVLTKKVVAYLKENPPDKVYAEINAGDKRFIDRDLYPFITDLKGLVLAHAVNPKLVGKDASENTDVDGKEYVKERLQMVKAKSSFWHEYKFTNPTTKKISSKQVYCEVAGESIICVGVYKQ